MNAAQLKILGLLVDVVDFELNHLADGMLLSQECDRIVERRPVLGRALIIVVGAVIVGHLANLTPERYDVLAQSFWARGARASSLRVKETAHAIY